MADTETPEPPVEAKAPPKKRTWRDTWIWWGFTHPLAWFVFFFVLGGWAVAGFILSVWGDGHEPPENIGSEITRHSICPSIPDEDVDDIVQAEAQWRAAGWHPRAVGRSECVLPPAAGEVQWRLESDVLSGWPVLSEHHGSAVTRPRGGPISHGVVYLKPRFGREKCVPAHEMGHTYGLADATAATSVMHHDCGTSWALVQHSRYIEAL